MTVTGSDKKKPRAADDKRIHVEAGQARVRSVENRSEAEDTTAVSQEGNARRCEPDPCASEGALNRGKLFTVQRSGIAQLGFSDGVRSPQVAGPSGKQRAIPAE